MIDGEGDRRTVTMVDSVLVARDHDRHLPGTSGPRAAPPAYRFIERQGNLAARDGCGIGGGAFSAPSTVAGSGAITWKETTYRYRFDGKSAGWVDRNVLARFGASRSVGHMPLIAQPKDRVAADTNWGAPDRQTEDGGHLVYQSEFVQNGSAGATTFDIYRTSGRLTRYTVVVECYGGAGIHGLLQQDAVTTTVP
jgi:hypothetical protein